MMCLMDEIDTDDIDDPTNIASSAHEWFETNWDPDLTLGEWWQRLAQSGYGFPTWPRERYGLGLARHDAPLVNVARRSVGARAEHKPPPRPLSQGRAALSRGGMYPRPLPCHRAEEWHSPSPPNRTEAAG